MTVRRWPCCEADGHVVASINIHESNDELIDNIIDYKINPTRTLEKT